MAELYEDDEYMSKAREALLEMLREFPADPAIRENLRKTLTFPRPPLPLKELRERLLKQSEDKCQELINLMKYVRAVRRKALEELLDIIERSSKHNSEDLIAEYIVADEALSELERMLCEKILDELGREDSGDPNDITESTLCR